MDISVNSSVPMPREKIIYKVWLPGEVPTLHEPALTLHDEKAVHFFVQALVRGPIPYFDGSFAISAHMTVCGAQIEIARGVYRIQRKNDGEIECEMVQEIGGALDEACKLPLIYSLLQEACEVARAA